MTFLDRYVAFCPGDALRAVGELLAPPLVGASAWPSVQATAAALPGVFHWAMLEVRMTAEAEQIDLLACVGECAGGRAALASALPQWPAQLGGSTPLLTMWSRDQGYLARVPVVWIECDHAALADPLVWVSVDPDLLSRKIRAVSSRWVADIAAEAHGVGPGPALAEAGRANLERCAAALPEGGRILAFASLRPRGLDRLRLFVRLPVAGAAGWLERIGWPGDRALADWWVRRVTRRGAPAFVQVEVDEAVLPYLAVEAPQTVADFPERWHLEQLLATFVDVGAAAQDKVDAVLAWPGQQAYAPGIELCRGFHVKLTLQPHGSSEAKVYLGVHLRERHGPAKPGT